MDFPVTSWRRAESAVFCKVADEHGGLSNMAGGFPIQINGVDIRTSEALYQAMRFPDLPDVQKLIIEQKSPMAAKMVTKPYLEKTRADWNEVRVLIMAWAIRVKLHQNAWFGNILGQTGNRPIVEQSHKDDFWGALVRGDTLIGRNVLGLLLTDLRDHPAEPKAPLDDMYLYGDRVA